MRARADVARVEHHPRRLAALDAAHELAGRRLAQVGEDHALPGELGVAQARRLGLGRRGEDCHANAKHGRERERGPHRSHHFGPRSPSATFAACTRSRAAFSA
jgi:hypothetical protein